LRAGKPPAFAQPPPHQRGAAPAGGSVG
jgi:hypothetical protein